MTATLEKKAAPVFTHSYDQLSMDMPLSDPDRRNLEHFETLIEAHLQSFIQVGMALMSIRDAKLYRETHKTFEDYCTDRWQIRKSHAYRLMEAVDVINNLSPIGDEINDAQLPQNEAQVRPLATLSADLQKEAWKRAQEIAGDASRIMGRHWKKRGVMRAKVKIER